MPLQKKEYTYAHLFGFGKDLGLTSQETKETAYSLTGKDSLRKLTQRELNEVCHELILRKDKGKQRPGRATDRQLHKIRELEQVLGWTGRPERLQGFLSKYYKVVSPLWLTPAQAARAIESLKAMAQREG